MKIIDLKDSPYSNSSAQNGFDSVSLGKVVLKTTNPKVNPSPHCVLHGAMNKMDSSGIWRCIACNVGCYSISYNQLNIQF